MIVITTPVGQIGRQVLGNLLASGEQLRVIVPDPSQLPAEVREERLMRWPPPSTPCRPCGQARAGSRSRRSRPSAPDAAARPSNKDAPSGIRVSR
jgi:hypothetical protein